MSVHLFGVRHHGPGSARSVRAALDGVRPSIVLVELPADATKALAWIGRPVDALVPPVALLGWVLDDVARAAFAPLAVFSPEWQAVEWANLHGVPVEAIDLPFDRSLATGAGSAGPEALRLPGTLDVTDPLAALAAAAGEPDVERWWEDVVEHRGEGLPAFDAVAAAMSAVRSGTIGSVADDRREAHMRTRIRAAVRAGHDRVAVVCGAWHVPALDPDAASATADRATLRGLPRVKVGVSWIPWSTDRLAVGTGYAAGVVSPGWYEHVFHWPGPDGVARFFVEVARVLRETGVGVSPDHLIAATRAAEALAALRERPRPGLTEVLDAAEAVMGGRSVVDRRLVVGSVIGSVPDGAPQVPLARDLAARQRAARLTPVAEERTIELDLRTPNGLRRSHLLHQVTALGVPWGTVEQGRGTTGTFRETWRLAWRPEWSVRVVELAADGNTLEAAATRRLIGRATDAATLAGAVGALDLALLGALHGAVRPIVGSIAARASTDPDVTASMAALGPLAQIVRYGDVRSTDASVVGDVFDGLVVRILAGLVPACASLDDDAAASVVARLGEVRNALALVDHPARRTAFPNVLGQLAESGGHGMVQGRATRILHDGGAWSPERVERRLGRALSSGTTPAAAASFVEGFVADSGTLLLHDVELRSAIDRWISSLPVSAFDGIVPLLRRTFGSFEAAERRQLGRLLAGGVHAPATGPDIDDQRALVVLSTVRTLIGLRTVGGPE